MPRSKCVSSLFQLCLASVVENMDDVWCKHYVETYTKENKFYMYVIGPFDSIPSKVIEEIISLLKKERRLKKHYVDLLITQQLRVLDLSRETDEVGYPLRLASIRCSSLKSLSLSGCPKISKQVYQEYLPQLERLQILDISNTSSGDSCLFVLGAYCKDLRELNATGCPITDSGIKGLCVSVDDLGQPSDRLGQCKSIVKLLIEYTKVSKHGIRLALENLPNLKVLNCCSSVQVLASMHKEALDNGIPYVPHYSLIDLHCTNETFDSPYLPGALSAAVSLCSSLMKLRLITQETLFDEDLLCLVSCERLRELSIGSGEACNITFDGGIHPVLQAVGKTLVSLSLAEMPSVNLRTLAQFCPDLRTLLLFMNHNYSLACVEEERSPFTQQLVELSLPLLEKLEEVHLACVSHLWSTSVAPSDSLPLLLSSPTLRHVYFKDCPSLTDGIFQKLFESHRFRSLEHLELEQCNSITKRSIDLLFNPGNPLRILKLWECQSITCQNANDWRKKAKKKKWQIAIDWS